MDWYFNNPMDYEAGFPLYLPLAIVISAGLTLVFRRMPIWLVWPLALIVAVFVYTAFWVAWRGFQSTMAIGVTFTLFAYFPVTGLTVLAVRILQNRMSSKATSPPAASS